MYELKMLLPQFDIKLPTNMYTLKNVSLSADACGETSNINSSVSCNGHISSVSSESAAATTSLRNIDELLNLDILGAKIQQLLKSSDNFDAIVIRQERVLQQLDELKNQMSHIRSTLGLCGKSIQHTMADGGLREQPLHDVVINGHPNFIPYALLAMKNWWKDLFTIDIKIFTHSTMPDIGAEAREFEKKLAQVPVVENKLKINVSLIWKNCEHTEMISSPTMYVPIYGEVNIIRYLGRIGPKHYQYEDNPMCNEIDAVLDICYQLLRCTTPKARAAMIRSLNSRLQKQKYFAGDEVSIADIGVHSSLKRMPAITDKDLTPALIEWRKRVQSITKI